MRFCYPEQEDRSEPTPVTVSPHPLFPSLGCLSKDASRASWHLGSSTLSTLFMWEGFFPFLFGRRFVLVVGIDFDS